MGVPGNSGVKKTEKADDLANKGINFHFVGTEPFWDTPTNFLTSIVRQGKKCFGTRRTFLYI